MVLPRLYISLIWWLFPLNTSITVPHWRQTLYVIAFWAVALNLSQFSPNGREKAQTQKTSEKKYQVIKYIWCHVPWTRDLKANWAKFLKNLTVWSYYLFKKNWKHLGKKLNFILLDLYISTFSGVFIFFYYIFLWI